MIWREQLGMAAWDRDLATAVETDRDTTPRSGGARSQGGGQRAKGRQVVATRVNDHGTVAGPHRHTRALGLRTASPNVSSVPKVSLQVFTFPDSPG